MAYPIHPSQSEYDLKYSVLYDDISAENALAIIRDLDRNVPFPPAPEPHFKVKVKYQSTEGGTLQGDLIEMVWAGEKPQNVPMPTNDKTHIFSHWEVNGEVVSDPENYTVTRDTTFTAVFEYTPPTVFKVTLYEARPLTTATTTNRVTSHEYEYEEGDEIPLTAFQDTTAGPTIDEDGMYMDDWKEFAYKDTNYQRIQNTESLTANTNYYRKSFFAGPGGHLRAGNSDVYAYTSTVSTWSSITTPTPVPDTGWEFVQWINLETGATVSNPASGNNTSRASTKYAAIFRKS